MLIFQVDISRSLSWSLSHPCRIHAVERGIFPNTFAINKSHPSMNRHTSCKILTNTSLSQAVLSFRLVGITIFRYIYLDPPRVSNFNPPGLFLVGKWGPNFRPDWRIQLIIRYINPWVVQNPWWAFMSCWRGMTMFPNKVRVEQPTRSVFKLVIFRFQKNMVD